MLSDPRLAKVKVGIVTSRFNDIVTSRLAHGAKETLLRRGIDPQNIVSTDVPGAFEVPLLAQWMIEEMACDGIVALAAVIRGSTGHYDYVCRTSSSGIMQVQLKTSRPVGFGILTCDSLEQAFDRAGGKLGNKGCETAETVLEMILRHRELVRV